MTYVDGFLLAVPDENKDRYREIAKTAAEVFLDHGALKVVEAWGNDVPEGEVTSFPMAVKREPGETVVFSFIVWPSREARDEGHKAAFDDPRLDLDPAKMPCDMKRMMFGGFEVLLEMERT